jgi:ATP-dependent Lon protease
MKGDRVVSTPRKSAGRRRLRRLQVEYPLLPVRDIVVFPYMVLPLFVGRETSLRAVESALSTDRRLVLVAQRQAAVEEPNPSDLYRVGTVVSILRMLKLPDGRLKLLVQGQAKIRIQAYTQLDPYFTVRYEALDDVQELSSLPLEQEALVQLTRQQLERLLSMGRLMPPDILILADNFKSPGRLADLIAANIGVEMGEAQRLLELQDPVQRLRRVGDLLNKELEMMAMQHKIQSEAREEMSKTQREYFLREQLKLIQKELGEVDERAAELLELKERIEQAEMPVEVKQESRRHLTRLERMHPEAAEASMVRSYLEWLVELPWMTMTADRLDLQEARRVLEEDHYGLEPIKERILEYLGVRKLKEQMKGPILCFVGPPGVGKTSLGKSIARALDRKFVRLSLGGIRDEAEIRGHRRTYVGSLPGRIIQNMRLAGSANPVFMLDEVDKIGLDVRGDPAAALLEVLDPEQNHTFSDHYLGVPFDLSRVMFIATANVTDPIPNALRDRMEIIRLSGYTEDEKRHIARRYLLPRQLREHGLDDRHLRLSDATISRVITVYTREAGLRNLDRELATICRKIARKVAEGRDQTSYVHTGNLHRYLGVRKYLPEAEQHHDEVGVVTGLAWTEAGGEIMHVEATVMAGKGQLTLTGSLGDVMKESAQAALSYTRARAHELGIPQKRFRESDLHIHVPAGAIPKDGPSAGVAMATALISALSTIPVSHIVAMSGEITLRGQILAVGGIKEKVLAAKRSGVQCIVLPHSNRPELEGMPAKIRRDLRVVFVDTMDQVLAVALAPQT